VTQSVAAVGTELKDQLSEISDKTGPGTQLNDIALRYAIIASARDHLPTPAYRLEMEPRESTCPVPVPEFESKLAVQKPTLERRPRPII
jgi:hypothetical protein